jgi:hypothetical protein
MIAPVQMHISDIREMHLVVPNRSGCSLDIHRVLKKLQSSYVISQSEITNRQFAPHGSYPQTRVSGFKKPERILKPRHRTLMVPLDHQILPDSPERDGRKIPPSDSVRLVQNQTENTIKGGVILLKKEKHRLVTMYFALQFEEFRIASDAFCSLQGKVCLIESSQQGEAVSDLISKAA